MAEKTPAPDVPTPAAPRWEWRSFGPSLAELREKIGLCRWNPPRPSAECYLLHPASPHNAKIRDSLLDVKRLQRTADDGLELWSVALKHGFPLSAQAVNAFYLALDLAPPPGLRGSYGLEGFLSEMTGRDPAFKPLHVRKVRRRLRFGGCAAEFAQLRLGARVRETFCLEHEDPERVRAALRALALAPGANLNYPKFMKREMAQAG
jgi:hypothetical protein